MKCIIGHEIRTETGFKVFEAGVDYPAAEIGDRQRYFEAPTKEPPAKRGKKTEEVTSDDSV